MDGYPTHMFPDYETDRMPCCGMTPAEWKRQGSTALCTTSLARNVTCTGMPSENSEGSEAEGGAWRVDLGRPRPDQVRTEPLTRLEQEHGELLRAEAGAGYARLVLDASRKAAALLRMTAMARDGDQRCQDVLDLLGNLWRPGE